MKYKDDPTIFAWDLMNEPRYQDVSDIENKGGTTLRKWVDEMAGYIKSLNSNHMVCVGIEGHELEFIFSQGNSALVTVIIIVRIAPSTPTKVTASNIMSTSAKISWNEAINDIGIKEYEIFVNEDLVDVATTNTYTLKELDPNTTYSITIKAVDLSGNSSKFSEALSITTSLL